MRIKEICECVRDSRGLTQKDIADMLGFTPQYISKFENGKSRNMLLLLFYISIGASVFEFMECEEIKNDISRAK